jgi:hypothetical protein
MTAEEERAVIVAWLRENADQLMGKTLTGKHDIKFCEFAARVIETTANDIEAKVHLDG